MKLLTLLFFNGVFLTQAFAQLLDYPNLNNKSNILFIGETHRIQENYILEYDLIKHYVENEGFNAVVLEHSTSFQIVIDNMINNNDTTGIHSILPIVLCNQNNCVHDFKPVINHLIRITDYAREKNIPIFCFDTEENFKKTKKTILKIVECDSSFLTLNNEDVFFNLRQANQSDSIQQELLILYNKKQQLKHLFSVNSFKYIDNILTNVYLETQYDRQFRLREEYLFQKFNNLLRTHKNLKPIALYGQAHVHKHCDPEINFSTIMPNHNSLVARLNNNKESVCKNKVTSIALTYFFSSGSDTSLTYYSYFEKDDLIKLKKSIGNQKYAITKPNEINLSEYISKAYDYIISINDAHKLLKHMRFYRKKLSWK